MTDSPAISDPYLVQAGDTISAIAQRSGKSIADIKRLNGLNSAMTIEVGQTLYLSEQTAFGFTALFLDALRNPIQNLKFQLRLDGTTVSGTTQADGLSPRQTTKSADSVVEVLVQDFTGAWQQLAKVQSGYGNKLLTLVSGYLVTPGQTELHPDKAPFSLPDPPRPPASPNQQPPLPAPPSGEPTKNNPKKKKKRTHGPEGQPVLTIGIEIPQGLLDFFAQYRGGAITEDDWIATSRKIGCEAALLKAISEVESGGKLSFWRLNKTDGANIPALLYERHVFSRQSAHAYDKTHPDLSWKSGYVRLDKKHHLKDKNAKMPDGFIESTDIYSDYVGAYLRLINAYAIDKEAALKACSWGKFQILGENFALCGMRNVNDFVTKMCTSEAEQIDLLAGFIQNKPAIWKDRHNHKLGKYMSLHEAVKTKNWAMIAFNYNGEGYKTLSYDTRLEAAYAHYQPPKA